MQLLQFQANVLVPNIWSKNTAEVRFYESSFDEPSRLMSLDLFHFENLRTFFFNSISNLHIDCFLFVHATLST